MSIQSNNIIVAPVSIADVKSTLGVSSNDLGTLCSHTNIDKMWNVHKPISVNKISALTNLEKANACWGITPYVFTGTFA